MKKLLLILSAFSAMSCGAFAATAHKAYVSVGANGTPETALPLKEITDGDYYVIRKQGPEWSDYYFYISTPSIISGGSSITYSTAGSDGYNPGIRANYYFMLDANNSSFKTLNGTMFSFSNNGNNYGASSSAGFHLMSKDGSAVEFKVVNNKDELVKWSVNLASHDGNGAYNEADVADIRGEKGRFFSVGENVTAKAKVIAIEGKLVTSLTEGYTDSLFTIKKGGAIEASQLFVNNSNLLVEESGAINIINSNTASQINGTSNVQLNGSAIFTSGLQFCGGQTTVGSTGVISAAGLRINGGALHVDGAIQGLNGGSVTLASSGGTFSASADADLSKVYALNLEQGTLNVTSDINIGVLRTTENKTAELNVSDGKTFTAGQSNFQANSNTTINGNLTITDGTSINSGSTFTVESGTTTFGGTDTTASVLSNSGVLNVNKGATVCIRSVPTNDLQIDGARALLGGTINLDGGKISMEVNSLRYNAVAGLISGTTTLKNGASIELSTTQDRIRLGIAEGATLSVSADSSIKANSIVFTRKTSTDDYKNGGKLILGSGDNFKGDIIVLRMAGATVELAKNQSYEFSKLQFHHYAGNKTGEANNITFDLNGASSLHIGSVENFSNVALGSLIFKDFQEGVVIVDNLSDAILAEINANGSANIGKLSLSMTAVDENGVAIAGDWSLKNGFLSHSAFANAVPEPAEWAVIFGAIALGLAMYRRRK